MPEIIQDHYAKVKKYVANLSENISKGQGLLLKGSVGTMKTTLAVAILREYVMSGGSGLFITMSGLLDNIFTPKAQSLDKWAKFAVVLRLYRIHQMRERLAPGDKYEKHGLVFCTNIDRPVEARNLIRAFHRIRDKLGLSKDLTIHNLRYTFSTRLLEQGVDLKTVSELLGHKDISTTGNIYAHVTPEMRTGAASKMNELIKRKKAPPKKGKVLTLVRNLAVTIYVTIQEVFT